MKGVTKFGIWMLALSLVSTLSVEAQPSRQMRGPAGMMGGARVEQILGFLAFDEKVGVTDDQLLELRKVLKEIYVKQQEMMQEIQQQMRDSDGDFQQVREKMMALRGEMGQMNEEMQQKISGVLNAKQVEQFKKHMEKLQSDRQSRRGRRSRQSGRDRE